MRQARIVAMAVVLAAALGGAFAAEDAGDLPLLLERGIFEEETAGDINGAIGIYEQIIQAEKSRRPYLAEAHLRLGLCYLKQDKPREARAAFDVVAEKFADVAEVAARARKELAALLPDDAAPVVVSTSPLAFAGDVPASLEEITVTFNREMMDGSWSWTGGGETYPELRGKPFYNKEHTTCTLPVKLKPGHLYWVGINSPSHRNFKTPKRVPSKWYIILFATRTADGKPTPLPADRLARAMQINAAHSAAAAKSAAAAASRGDVVVEGVGWGAARLGATREEVMRAYGASEDTRDDRLDYNDALGFDIYYGMKKVAREIHFNRGFKGKLSSGISIAGSMEEVFRVYGEPLRKTAVQKNEGLFETRVLYQLPSAAKITYRDRGVLFWFDGSDRVTQIVIFKVNAVEAAVAARYVSRQMRLTRLKNDLIATVTHELKTPLASMRVLVDTLLDGRCESADRAREYYGLIAAENERLSRLIDNFLTFSRMERPKHAFNFTAVPPSDVVAAAAASMAEKCQRPSCTLTVNVPDSLPAVRADRDALITVLLNLLENACKYTGDEKEIALGAYAAEGSVSFEVSENGIGLSRRDRRRIFERFYQVDRSLSTTGGGCGLGLAIVKSIVDAHEGSVEVADRPEGGSIFTVRLPSFEPPERGAQ